MTSLFERFERSEIELFHLNQIVDIGHVWTSKLYCAMFKITKCEKRVVCLQFALIATSRLKLSKVLKVIFAWLKVVPVLHFLCSKISNLFAYCIQNGHILTN